MSQESPLSHYVFIYFFNVMVTEFIIFSTRYFLSLCMKLNLENFSFRKNLLYYDTDLKLSDLCKRSTSSFLSCVVFLSNCIYFV